MSRIRRTVAAVVVAGLVALIGGACTPGTGGGAGGASSPAPAATTAPSAPASSAPSGIDYDY